MRLVKLNYKGFVALRNSPEVIGHLESIAKRVQASAGDGFEVGETRTNYSMSGRASSIVYAGTPEAMMREATDSALTRALVSGGG